MAMVLALCGTSLVSCVAQQADLVRLQKEFDSRIVKLDREKQVLEASVAQVKEDSARILDQQKAELVELIRARAQIKSELRRLREESLTRISGDVETQAHRIDQINLRLDEMKLHVEGVMQLIDQRDQERALQITTLATNVDQQFAQYGEQMTQQIGGFRQSLLDFKEVLAGVKGAVVQEEERSVRVTDELSSQLVSTRGAMTEQFEKVNQSLHSITQAFTQDLKKATMSLRSRIDAKDVQAGKVHRRLDTKVQSVQHDVSEVSTQQQAMIQTMTQLRDALAKAGEVLGQRLDEQSRDLALVTERLGNRLDHHEKELVRITSELAR